MREGHAHRPRQPPSALGTLLGKMKPLHRTGGSLTLPLFSQQLTPQNGFWQLESQKPLQRSQWPWPSAPQCSPHQRAGWYGRGQGQGMAREGRPIPGWQKLKRPWLLMSVAEQLKASPPQAISSLGLHSGKCHTMDKWTTKELQGTRIMRSRQAAPQDRQ